LLAAATYSGTPQTADGSTSLAHVTATRDLVALPAGPLALALGAEVRWERLSYDWDPAVLTGDSPIGSRLKSNFGERRVTALFAEANVPILRGLETQLAVRYDGYTDFGSTTNPKLGMRWKPAATLLLRGSWGEGFRAPPLYSLNEPNVDTGIAAVRDPVRCDVTGSVDDCLALVPYTAGGNPALQAETSTQWGGGAVWEPVRGLSIAVDYWNIEQQGVIAPLDPFNAANYARFPGRVKRGPTDPAFPGLPGPLVGFDASLINIGTTQTSGIDVALDWRPAPVAAGAFRLSLVGTYVRQFDAQVDGVRYGTRLASALNGPPVPRWRSTVNVDWSRGPWGATLAQSYASGYVEALPVAVGGQRKVDVASTWDAQARYDGMPGWQFAAGIRNLLDQDPPFSLTSSFQFGFNPQVASPLGRTFYARASYRLR
jgi:iron complex outermembrane receptor protein